ncbi:ATP-grasp fold amidoligase family protein [Siccirubricoccus phaeus]|uniref:ATP-grasp fold amidoligase family protein n=1 Tax=Siccirubricoccus phaeus TaxID=2595053 RepID=UPI00165AAD2D|nr:ATP-grasp fold amidoligase family protein [Siccirubricoccus phaeus]
MAAWRDAIAQVRAMYRHRHGRLPDLLRPRRFSEKMQWRKLFQRDPRFAVFSDKLAVRGYVAARLGEEVLIPLLWSGAAAEAIPFERLDPPYVLKPSHASGRHVVVTGAPDIPALRAAARDWLAYCHGTQMAEPGYFGIPRRLMAERFLAGEGGGPPVEHRLFTFSGRVRMIQTTLSLGPGAGWAREYYDRGWHRLRMELEYPPASLPLPAPERRGRMVEMAEALAAGTDHLRVDLYNVPAGIRVGELTLYSWSGLAPFRRDADDLWLGQFWEIERPVRQALRAVALTGWAAPASRYPDTA